MLSRALILATVTFLLGCFGTTLAGAQNLEAGKAPSQIFASTCSLCHKGARGLLKSVAPGSLPGFLRQHYTTSTDMAAAMSAYVLSNGAANAPVAGGNLTKQGQEAKSGPKPEGRPEPRPEQAAKGRKPPTREAARPDVDGLEDGASPAPGNPAEAAPLTARQKAAAERRAARQAARDRDKDKAGKGEAPPKIEARHESSPKEDPAAADSSKADTGKTERAKTESPKTEPPKTEPGKTETAKIDGTRPDPVPAVTPAPKEADKPAAAVAAVPPKDDAPSGPLTIDIGPPPPPAAVAASAGPSSVPAGKPVPPISR